MTPEVERLIDRLVDDELRPDERGALLARLDAEPDGWRRCALAFLEAQCWRAALEPAARIVTNRCLTPSLPLPQPRRAVRPGKWLTVAAGLFLAFALGWVSRGSGPAPRAGVARPDPARGTEFAKPRLAAVSSTRKSAAEERPSVPTEYAGLPAERLEERWLRQAPTPLPEPVRKQWERRGFRVEQRHGLASLDVEGGRRVTVPVDEVKLRYVGRRTY